MTIPLLGRWAAGIDEGDPTYGFIGVEGGPICWVDELTPSDARRIVSVHNQTLDLLLKIRRALLAVRAYASNNTGENSRERKLALADLPKGWDV
jgi:hypothetical protein